MGRKDIIVMKLQQFSRVLSYFIVILYDENFLHVSKLKFQT